MIPLLLRLRIEENERTLFCLWLPLFLIFPFIFLFDLIAVPLALIFSSSGKRMERARILLVEPFRILNALRGLKVDVKTPYNKVWISVQ